MPGAVQKWCWSRQPSRGIREVVLEGVRSKDIFALGAV